MVARIVKWAGAGAPVSSPEYANGTDPSGEIRLGWLVVILFFVIGLGFAAFVRLDAAAYAEGRIEVSGNRQAVQHRDGGIVTALNVHEGQRVAAGQILIELAGAEVAANERGLAAQVIGLEAEHARLETEAAGAADIRTPADWAGFDAADRALADKAMMQQRTELAARRRSQTGRKRVLAQQAAELQHKIGGYSDQIDASHQQDKLLGEQLQGMRELAKKGFASVNRVRDLERDQAAMQGDRANLAASSSAARAQIGEVRMQALGVDADALKEVSEEMRHNEEALNTALPKWQAARSQLEATRIRAPVAGQVVGLTVFTVGGVIAPGQKLMEIVPDHAQLVIEATISPNDIDNLYLGQTAEVKISALHERNLPVIEGKVTRLSEDSFENEKTGQRYYTGQVVVAAADFRRLTDAAGSGPIRAGLPAQILVPLRKRTMLQYLLEPVDQALWRSGREH